jgi:hypothetical protein
LELQLDVGPSGVQMPNSGTCRMIEKGSVATKELEITMSYSGISTERLQIAFTQQKRVSNSVALLKSLQMDPRWSSLM